MTAPEAYEIVNELSCHVTLARKLHYKETLAKMKFFVGQKDFFEIMAFGYKGRELMLQQEVASEHACIQGQLAK